MWQDLTGREIKFMNIDVAKEYDLLLQLFKDYKPDTVMKRCFIFCACSLDCGLYVLLYVRSAGNVSKV